MKKQEIIDKHQKYLFSCVATYYEEPLVVDRAKGSFVYDIDGKEYLDFFGGILTISVGHCNETVTQAIDAQTHKLQHASTLYPNEPHVRLAERLAQLTPGRLQKSFFPNSGTEANGTPRPILNQISKEVARILDLPDIKERLQALGIVPAPTTPEEHDKILRAQIETLSKVVRDAGLRPK